MVLCLTSILLQCDVASLCIWFRAREIRGRTLEDEPLRCLKMSRTRQLATRCHITDLLIPQAIHFKF